MRVECEYIEIYNDKIYDLLAEGTGEGMDQVDLGEDTGKKQFFLKN